jgi:phosphate transport system protein
MSIAALNTPTPEPAYSYLVKRTIEACAVAKDAAAAAAEGIATGSSPLLNTIREREKELDTLDREIDDGVTLAITQVSGTEARELLACMKFMISLERIGDLLLSFASSAQSAGPRIAVDVLRADAEMDRLRNLIFLRHIENPEGTQRQASLQVIFMTQSLERAGDHAKNLAEEVCHFVSGHTIRHIMMTYDKPIEQMFLDWLRHRDDHH